MRLSGERRQAGVGLKADELRARVFLSEAERRSVSAENDLILARRRLAVAMGREGEVEIAAPLEPQRLTPPAEVPLQRADLEAMRQQVRAAALAHEQSRAAYLPRLGLAASYALHDGEAPFGTDADSWTVRAGLSWELFDGGRRHYAASRTAATEKAAAARVREATRQARLAVDEAQRRAAEARLQAATAQASLAEAQESYRLTRQRFDAGLVDLSELLATQSALDRVRFDRIQAESRYLLALGNQHFQQGDFVQTLLPASKEDQP